MDLTLKRDKTRETRLAEGFDFIGVQLVKRKSPKSGKNTISLFPAQSAQQTMRNKLQYLTSRRAPIRPQEFVAQVNPLVTGGVTYFRHTNASQAFRGLPRFVNIRFRRYLTQRSTGRGFGWQRYPNRKLYVMGRAPTWAAAGSSTWRNLCTVGGEDSRTAGFGKTERTVGGEGNGR